MWRFPPTERNVYLASTSANALVVFDRNPGSGALTQRKAITDGDLDGVTVSGLGEPEEIVLSSDDGHLYLVVDRGVVHFSREVR